MIRNRTWWIKMKAWFAASLGMVLLASAQGNSGAPDLKRLERSFSVHASLASLPQRSYSTTNLPAAIAPSESEIRNAARLLTYEYAANRLYLIYQKEISLPEAQRVFQMWRQACSPEVELVPAILLRTHNTNHVELFTETELRSLIKFFKAEINRNHLALFDHGGADQPLRTLAAEYPEGLLRLGLEVNGGLAAPFHAAVADTSSVLSHGQTNDEWQKPEFGSAMLGKLIQSRNDTSSRLTWSLLVAATEGLKNGHAVEHTEKNPPVPPGRNKLAVAQVFHSVTPSLLAGFSADLDALQSNSRALAHDGTGYSFYEMLKRGQIYVGFYARPFHEIAKIYQDLRIGKTPSL